VTEVHIGDGYANAVIRWSAAGKDISSTLGLENLGTFTAAQMADDLYGSLVVSTGGLCKATNMFSAYRFNGVDVTSNLGGVMTGASSSGPTVTGTVSSSDVPLNSTTCIFKKKTALIGRKHRGRLFIPCLQIEDAGIDPSGAIGSIAQSIQNATMQHSFVAMQASTFSYPVLLHSDPTLGPDRLTALEIAGTVGIQKRRLIR
jgi:hypothetical protein